MYTRFRRLTGGLAEEKRAESGTRKSTRWKLQGCSLLPQVHQRCCKTLIARRFVSSATISRNSMSFEYQVALQLALEAHIWRCTSSKENVALQLAQGCVAGRRGPRCAATHLRIPRTTSHSEKHVALQLAQRQHRLAQNHVALQLNPRSAPTRSITTLRCNSTHHQAQLFRFPRCPATHPKILRAAIRQAHPATYPPKSAAMLPCNSLMADSLR